MSVYFHSPLRHSQSATGSSAGQRQSHSFVDGRLQDGTRRQGGIQEDVDTGRQNVDGAGEEHRPNGAFSETDDDRPRPTRKRIQDGPIATSRRSHRSGGWTSPAGAYTGEPKGSLFLDFSVISWRSFHVSPTPFAYLLNFLINSVNSRFLCSHRIKRHLNLTSFQFSRKRATTCSLKLTRHFKR